MMLMLEILSLIVFWDVIVNMYWIRNYKLHTEINNGELKSIKTVKKMIFYEEESAMSWKLEIYFSDGTSELVDEDFETEQDAKDEYYSWLDSWRAGRETLMLAGRDYIEADIEGCKIWEE